MQKRLVATSNASDALEMFFDYRYCDGKNSDDGCVPLRARTSSAKKEVEAFNLCPIQVAGDEPVTVKDDGAREIAVDLDPMALTSPAPRPASLRRRPAPVDHRQASVWTGALPPRVIVVVQASPSR
jgi:hypothetical protein